VALCCGERRVAASAQPCRSAAGSGSAVLRALFFDDQGMSQGGQLCQREFWRGIRAFRKRWVPAGFAGFPKWLPHLPGWILGFLSRIHPAGLTAPRNLLLYKHFIPEASRGGFQVDSPVKKPVASEMPRCAPPYTQRPGEEPWEGGLISSLKLTFSARFRRVFRAALQFAACFGRCPERDRAAHQ